MDKKYRKLKKHEHKEILKDIKKTKNKKLYKSVKDILDLVENVDKQLIKEDNKIRKELTKVVYKLKDNWIKYEHDQVVETNIVMNEGDYPLIITKNNVFIGLNQDVWRLLKPDQRMYCLQMFIDTVCQEFNVDRLTIDFFIPDDLHTEDIGCIIKNSKFNFDCRLFENNVSAFPIVKKILYGIMENKKSKDRDSIMKSGKSTESLTLYELETLFVDVYNELGVLMPRFNQENTHILNILNGLNRMALIVPNYQDLRLNLLISQYENLSSPDYINHVKKMYNLKDLNDKIVEMFLRTQIIEKHVVQNEMSETENAGNEYELNTKISDGKGRD